MMIKYALDKSKYLILTFSTVNETLGGQIKGYAATRRHVPVKCRDDQHNRGIFESIF